MFIYSYWYVAVQIVFCFIQPSLEFFQQILQSKQQIKICNFILPSKSNLMYVCVGTDNKLYAIGRSSPKYKLDFTLLIQYFVFIGTISLIKSDLQTMIVSCLSHQRLGFTSQSCLDTVLPRKIPQSNACSVSSDKAH